MRPASPPSRLPSRRSPAPRVRRYRLRLRPRFLSPFWVRLSGPQGFASYHEQQEWILLLSARRLPFRLWKTDGATHCFVPALARDIALFEHHLYQQEEQRIARERRQPPLPPVRKGWQWAALAVLPLLLLHACRTGLLPVPPALPSPDLWERLGSLDSARLYIYHEGYRCLTALFLHGDAAHLYSNVMLSAAALAVAARTLGTGRACLMALLGGTLGNALAMLFRTPPYIALGFSTAFFAILGLLCGQARPWRGNAAIPLLAGGGLLALLGTEGAHVDYAGHIGGLLAGFALGAWERFRLRHHLPCLPGTVAGLLAAGLAAGGWLLAFHLL
ncbi:rhomboid family intramembrane serine protease [uncultured Desulfovibrio sp.]|uniref:rhomboid family intramembrane serine protease n=1 Tax=uncultured Desulfovibrio sp. TaxID=167968 RepID=UPI002623D667|nr:rhomboid family intramembrane serine protease [uncultured Desulfovibrio sp.]